MPHAIITTVFFYFWGGIFVFHWHFTPIDTFLMYGYVTVSVCLAAPLLPTVSGGGDPSLNCSSRGFCIFFSSSDPELLSLWIRACAKWLNVVRFSGSFSLSSLRVEVGWGEVTVFAYCLHKCLNQSLNTYTSLLHTLNTLYPLLKHIVNVHFVCNSVTHLLRNTTHVFLH